ncbi:MAG: ATP-grasp domain-containing protein [bacterium]
MKTNLKKHLAIKANSKLPYNVLVTASGLSPSGTNTILSLKNKVNKIVGVDINDNNTTKFFINSFYKVPLANNKNYIERLLYICRKEKIDAIFPLTIEEIITILKNKKDFKANKIKIIGEINLENIETCNDKWLTNQYLKNHNCPVPNAFSPNNVSELIQCAQKLGYPKKEIVFKPRIAHGSRGFRIIKNNYKKLELLINSKPTENIFISLNELINIIKTDKEFPKVILMDYLKGDDYSVYLFCNKGKAISVVPMKRTGLIPGMSTGGIIINNKDIINYVKNIARIFKFSGPINIQLIMTKNGPKVYEINTRISATTIATLCSNINYPLMAVLQVFDRQKLLYKLIDNISIHWNTELYRVQREIFKYKNNYSDLYEYF